MGRGYGGPNSFVEYIYVDGPPSRDRKPPSWVVRRLTSIGLGPGVQLLRGSCSVHRTPSRVQTTLSSLGSRVHPSLLPSGPGPQTPVPVPVVGPRSLSLSWTGFFPVVPLSDPSQGSVGVGTGGQGRHTVREVLPLPQGWDGPGNLVSQTDRRDQPLDLLTGGETVATTRRPLLAPTSEVLVRVHALRQIPVRSIPRFGRLGEEGRRRRTESTQRQNGPSDGPSPEPVGPGVAPQVWYVG